MRKPQPAFSTILVSAILVAAVAVVATPAHGQFFAPGAVSASMGGGGPAFVYGSEALFYNPANIASTLGTEITAGRATVSAGGNLLQFRFYNDLFTSGKNVSEADAQEVLDEWFGGAESGLMRSATVAAEAVPLAVVHRYGTGVLAYSVRIRSQSSVSLNGGWLDLLLSGTGQEREIPLDGSFGFVASTEFGVSYARPIGPEGLTVGVTPKLIFGSDFTDARLESTAVVSDSSVTHTFDYRVRAAGGLSRDLVDHVDFFSSDVIGGGSFSPKLFSGAGTGVGIDIGASYRINPSVVLAASFTDIGFIRWSTSAQTIVPHQNAFTFDGLRLDISEVRNRYDGNVGDYFLSTIDSLASAAYDSVARSSGAITTGLAASLHLGASWTSSNGKMTVAAGTSAPLYASPVRPSTFPQVHVGGEYQIGGAFRVPLRAGVRVGGASAMTLSFGFGIHTRHYDFDIGVAASPRSDFVGDGARFMAGVSAITVRL